LEVNLNDELLRDVVEKIHSKNAERKYLKSRKLARVRSWQKVAIVQLLFKAMT
jgi:hypothetical protein